MPRDSKIVQRADVEIEIYTEGEGRTLVILPSYGRDGGADFDDLAARIAAQGWRVLRPQPRGVAGSRGPMKRLNLHILAQDVAAVIEDLGDGCAIVLGHAFGHAVAKMLATDHPGRVGGLILAAAQASKVPSDIATAPFVVGDPARSEGERLEMLHRAFFAPGHDARTWLSGWHPHTLRMQRAAAAATPLAAYWEGGRAPILEIFGAEDPFKPKASWGELHDQLGERVTRVVVQNASHALFPEQPDQVAEAIMDYLARG